MCGAIISKDTRMLTICDDHDACLGLCQNFGKRTCYQYTYLYCTYIFLKYKSYFKIQTTAKCLFKKKILF